MKIVNLLFLIPAFFISSCFPYKKERVSSSYYDTVREITGYQFNSPSEKQILGFELDEISGITWVKENQFACIQDEEGKIYLYDWDSQKVMERIKFGKSGDYEDLELVGSNFYVLKSNGYLYRVPIDQKKETKKIETPVKPSNNAEGLCLLKSSGQLLIALKGKGEIDDNKIKGKGFYTYDLKKEELSSEPLFNITKKNIKNSLPDSLIENPSMKNISFGPSGIALHPKTNQLFIISAQGNWLLILKKDYSIELSIPLKSQIFRQPEGICFTPNGDLYITNEANGGSANILKFDYKPLI